jgi:hypothetical protein
MEVEVSGGGGKWRWRCMEVDVNGGGGEWRWRWRWRCVWPNSDLVYSTVLVFLYFTLTSRISELPPFP